jgi:hypothetical protein
MVEMHARRLVDLNQSKGRERADSRTGLTHVKRAYRCDTLSHLRSRVRRENGGIT